MTNRRPSLPISALTICGLILAALSGTDLCNFGGCTEAHQYRLFNISLPIIGLLYFGLLSAAILLFSFVEKTGMILSLLLAGGAGAELTMIHLQKNVIQAWCPLCLGIAAVVYLLCLVRIITALPESRRLFTMNRRKFVYKSAMFSAAMIVGFLVSFVGISRPEASAMQLDTALGKQSSKIEVYVFSDWLCPMCLKIEPAIESVFPALGKKAKIQFIDKPIHPESMNFVPYHISFLINEKPKYLQIRKALFSLAKKNRNPSLDDIKAAVAPLGVTYKQLSFMEVTQTMGKAQALSTLYKVNATPTIVIVNTTTKKTKTLVGGSEITGENLLKAVKNLE
jgi:uncharacterized membrane protein